MKLRIGTRGSRLALLQAQNVVDKLRAAVPHLQVDIDVIKTAGDMPRRKTSPGMFVNEINRAVLRGEVDIGVHSLKDLPATLPRGVEIACVPERRSPNDVLVSRGNLYLKSLPRESVIGTDSPRRMAEISSLRPDLRFKKIRGNIDTRVRKVDEGLYDGAIIALAALERLGIRDRAAQTFELDEVVPAPGQGALAVVCRRGAGHESLREINDKRAWSEVTCERAFLGELEGGCKVGAGAVARVNGKTIDLIAVVHDGGRRLLKLAGRNPIELGKKAGQILCRAKST